MSFFDELLTFTGRWHPIFVHLPIGMLALAFAMATFSKWRNRRDFDVAIRFSLALATVASLLAAVTGYLLSRNGGYEADVLNFHQWLGIAVGLFSLLSWSLYRKTAFASSWKKALQKQRFVILCIAVCLLGLTGHYGGTLTHGKGYIRDALPVLIKEKLQITPAEDLDIRIENVQEAQLYADIIQPILIQRCQSCHGEKKREGGLAIHTKADLIQGGDNGSVLIGGDLSGSELHARLVLPEGNEKRMPPKGRTPISEDQIKVIGWWIAEGASFEKKVSEMPQSDDIKALLKKMEEGGSKESMLSEYEELPEAKELPATLVQQLQAKGIKVLPIASNSRYVVINAINYPELSDDDLKELLPLKDHIVQLKLGNTKITDNGLQYFSAFPLLRRLHLEHTHITDKGISHLTEHKNLVYLNLIGTKISDRGVEMLSNIPTLKQLYVYQTSVVRNNEKIKSSKIEIDTGHYHLPFLRSDTIRY